MSVQASGAISVNQGHSAISFVQVHRRRSNSIRPVPIGEEARIGHELGFGTWAKAEIGNTTGTVEDEGWKKREVEKKCTTETSLLDYLGRDCRGR
jgi:hypothetical protein